jgi:hypothetical protein
MQNGKHGATGMHASGSLSPTSCPHLGTTQTVASTSRHVPREMQSVVAAPCCVYRVKGQRTDYTYTCTPAHVMALGLTSSGKKTRVV